MRNIRGILEQKLISEQVYFYSLVQQQPPLDSFPSTILLIVALASGGFCSSYFLAIWLNISSTPVPSIALHSKYSAPIFAAYSSPY